MLCEAEDLDTGAMWECPLLIQLNSVPQQSKRQSEDAMRALGEAFNNISAFNERIQDDTAKSPSAAAANDPADYSKVSLHNVVSLYWCHQINWAMGVYVFRSCDKNASFLSSFLCASKTCKQGIL